MTLHENHVITIKSKISVFIIVYNEEHIIRKCLEKLTWCDEIIVVDSGSTDATTKICEQYGAKIYYRKFDGFGTQKQYALSLCHNDWVLSLDADEILSDQLIEEIKQVVENDITTHSEIAGYYLKRRMVFLDKIFHYGNESNRKIMRFFKKSKGTFTDAIVHETITVEGKKATLKSYLLHYNYTTITGYINTLNKYSSLGAEKAFIKKKKYPLFIIILKPYLSFIKSYFINFNIANGKKGFYWCFLSSFHDFIKCIKIEELYNKNR